MHTERLLDGPSILSAKTDSDGILHLISDYKDQNTYQHHVISVDTKIGYRLVGGLAIMERIDRPSRNHTDFLEVQWDKYESSWYVKSAKFASYDGIHSPEDRASLEHDNLRRSTVVKVTEFHPNVEISDSEFTSDGLKLPVGTPVVDRVSGINYRIRSARLDTDVPIEPSLEVEFPKSVTNQIDTQNIQQDTEVIAEQEEPEKEVSISSENPVQETLANTHSDLHPHENILMIGILSIGIIMVIVVIVMGLKLLLVRKAG